MEKIIEKILGSIEKLREKPDHIRHGVALGIAGGVTLMLFIIWLFVLFPINIDQIAQSAPEQNNSPFDSLKAQVSSAYDNFTKDLQNNSAFKSGTNWQNSYEKIKSQVTDNGSSQ